MTSECKVLQFPVRPPPPPPPNPVLEIVAFWLACWGELFHAASEILRQGSKR